MSRRLNWTKWRESWARDQAGADMEPPKRPGSVMSGKYLSLYTYLANRYADTVVLTFEQIESLLGFALPDPARLRQDWWTSGGPGAGESGLRDAWTLAKRTAKVNLYAQTVVFDRAS